MQRQAKRNAMHWHPEKKGKVGVGGVYLHRCLEYTAGRLARFLQSWRRLTRLAGTVHLALATGSVLHELLVVGDQHLQRRDLLGQWFLFEIW